MFTTLRNRSVSQRRSHLERLPIDEGRRNVVRDKLDTILAAGLSDYDVAAISGSRDLVLASFDTEGVCRLATMTNAFSDGFDQVHAFRQNGDFSELVSRRLAALGFARNPLTSSRFAQMPVALMTLPNANPHLAVA